MERIDGIAYREAVPASGGDAPFALLLHGFPESSYMWRDTLRALADAGYHAIAPDLPGYGDSQPGESGAWERHREALERLIAGLGIEQTAVVVHDWGGVIGLSWACEHPDAVTALVISDSGFFSDGKWHDLANTMRTEGEGEQLMEAFTREAFDAGMRQWAPGLTQEALDEYWKGLADEERKRAVLELYRSGDFSKLERYEGGLAALGVPTLVLWGDNDPFSGLAAARRFNEEIPGSEPRVIEGAGHFIFDDKPEEAAAAVASFLAGVRSSGAAPV